ncbi:TPA: hypothetical protein ACIGVA_001787, partial [Streptococcus pyogenes]
IKLVILWYVGRAGSIPTVPVKSSKKPTGLRSDEVRELHIALTQYALVITPWWLFIMEVRV